MARGRILKNAVANARSATEDLARAVTLEQGKPLGEARGEVSGALDTLEYFAEEGYRLLGEIVPTDSSQRLSFVVFQPVGVVAAIVPWNYPINLLCWKLGPALAAGCTIVAKPANQTPISALLLARLLLEGGLPGDVFSVVTGCGGVVGTELVNSPLSAKVSFTGSTEVGRIISRDCGSHFKRVGLELGGSSPLIVLRDADFEEAVRGGVYKAFRNAGQICNSINRIYVERPIYESYLEAFSSESKKLSIGDGLENPDIAIGPLIDEPSRQRVREHVKDALEKGARLLCGGREPEDPALQNGFFYLPTVLADVNHEMLVMREETFGPVAPIMPVEGFSEAIERANDTPFGLVGYVYTTSITHAVEAGRQMHCGSVGINETSFSGAPYPYPAWKDSGTGVELSRHGLMEFLKIKHIRLRLP
jgi:acyl-CoA reductase-like NAD-dependent aldehyde dehydrogenase